MKETLASQMTLNGAFETLRAYGARPFMLEAHIARLSESSRSSGIKMPLPEGRLAGIVKDAVRARGYNDAYVRIALNRGRDNITRVSVIVKESKFWPERFYRRGVSVTTVAARRNSVEAQNPRIKSSSFLNGILAKIEARAAFEAIMLNCEGLITEGSVSNVFIVKEKEVLTPPAHLGVLVGITRGIVLGLARELGLAAREIPFTRHELFNADECFLTNTSMEIMPVAACDGRVIGGKVPGPITAMLKQRFGKLVREGATMK